MRKQLLYCKIFCLVLVGLLSLNNLTAQEKDVATDVPRYNTVYTSVPSLQISPSARAGGMADVGASTTPDVFSQYYNPSKYAFLSSKAGVSFLIHHGSPN